MPITKLLRAVFGLGRSGSDGGESTTVTVEHDPEATDDEAAETEGADEGGATDADQGTAEPDAEAVAGPRVDSEDAEVSAVDAAEAETEAAGEGDSLDEAGVAADAAVGSGTGADAPVDAVSGIGPSYAETLGEAGVETVGDLLAAAPDDLADGTDISAKRISRWQDAAEDT